MTGYVVVNIPETRQGHVVKEEAEVWHSMDTDCSCQPRVERETGLDGREGLVIVHKDERQ